MKNGYPTKVVFNVGQTLDMDKYWTWTNKGQKSDKMSRNPCEKKLDKYWTNFGHGQYLDKGWASCFFAHPLLNDGQILDKHLSKFCPSLKFVDKLVFSVHTLDR